MPEEYDEKRRIKEERDKQKKLEEQRVETTKEIVKTLIDQKRIEIEHLNLVEQHQKYWNEQLRNTNRDNRERYDDLKNKIKQEEKIRNKIIDHIKHLDKEIEFRKKHIH
ncbi:hypothetical protein [Methanobacterium oryzae]|uniref:hypothetical protein n=1 Tax=Methanobacterium oryzae TaxID=69540 RepID=UPI003D225305